MRKYRARRAVDRSLRIQQQNASSMRIRRSKNNAQETERRRQLRREKYRNRIEMRTMKNDRELEKNDEE